MTRSAHCTRRGGPAMRLVASVKYLASVAAAGRDAGEPDDTTTISSAETSVIGTTGSSAEAPSSRRRCARSRQCRRRSDRIDGRARRQAPARPICSAATASTAAAVQTVATRERAPRVLPFQKSAATQQRRQRRVAGERVLAWRGRRSTAARRARSRRRRRVSSTTNRRPVCTCTRRPEARGAAVEREHVLGEHRRQRQNLRVAGHHRRP